MLGIEYQLKPSGHRHALLESSGRRSDWQYDAHYRLTQETISSDTAGPNGSAAYTYDAVGNRQTRTSTLGLLSNQSFSYNANDWLATDTYDSSGNTTASEGNADTYDFLNRLIRRITPTHALLDYEYNAEGILIAKTKNNNREEYHIDGNNPTGYAQVVETFFDTGSGLELTATHHYGHDLVSVHQTNGSTWQRHFYLYDGLGSVRALANEIGTVTDIYTYDAFGTLLHTTGSTANPYRYTGERFDPDLGMYYLRARYMNTNTGRFWTMDSYEGRNSDPITLHKYLYANANPIMYVDPSGMSVFLASQGAAMSISNLLYAATSVTLVYAFLKASENLALSEMLVRDTQEISLQPESKPIPLPIPVFPITNTKDNDHSGCSTVRIPPKGGNSEHNSYAASFQGGIAQDLLVTGRMESYAYDAAAPYFAPVSLFEVKTRHEFLINERINPYIMIKIKQNFDRAIRVATECGFIFSIPVNNQIAYEGFKKHFPNYPIVYIKR